MGQEQSNNTEDNKQAVKRDYYELLEIEKDATQQQIDKAYKKAALKWHPDKNRDEDTTPIFQACQEAYQVLSDPHERQWYDDHKDQILKGVNPEDAKEEDSSYITPSDLIQFINPAWYPGKFDMASDRNFYQVYRELFKRLDKEEEEEEDVTKDHKEAPTFGDADTYIDDVLAFYRFWEIFGTIKPFAYADVHDTTKASFSREKRFMSTENNKERKKERIKFNQTVRDVLEFVRKRDPRYQTYIKEKQDEKDRKKAAEVEKKRKAAEEHQKRMDEYRERLRQQHEEMEAEGETDEEEEIPENKIMCQICNKDFKTEGAFKTHWNSKKHKQKVAKFGGKLAENVVAQDKELNLAEEDKKIKQDEDEKANEAKQEILNEYVNEEQERIDEKQRKKQEKKNRKNQEKEKQKPTKKKGKPSSDDEDDNDKKSESDNESEKENDNNDSDSEKSDKNSDEEAEAESESSEEEKYVSKSKLKQMNKKCKGKANKKESEQSSVLAKLLEEKNKEKQEKLEKKKNKKKQVYANQVKKQPGEAKVEGEANTEENKDQLKENAEEQVFKKKRRRRAKDKDAEGEKKDDNAKAQEGGEFSCRVCKKDFPSASKLHKHLKQSGHASAK